MFRKFIVGSIAVSAVTMASMAAGYYLDQPSSLGEEIAHKTVRVKNQVSDTKAAFTDIKELIPESPAPPALRGGKLPSAETPRTGTTASIAEAPGQPPAPVERDPEGVPIDPNARSSQTARESVAAELAAGTVTITETDADGNVTERQVMPTMTWNQQVRMTQGDAHLTRYQEAMDRIVDNWTPQYESAKREHQKLMDRIDDTWEIWPQYIDRQYDLIHKQSNKQLRDVMFKSVDEDRAIFDRWSDRALDVQLQSSAALEKIEDMNTFIQFYKNQSDYRAITEYNDLEVPILVTALIDSLDSFEHETKQLAQSMGQ